MFRTKNVEKIKTQILYSVLFAEIRALHETLRKILVEPDGTQMTINNGTCALHAG
jgi:hypothetical protein